MPFKGTAYVLLVDSTPDEILQKHSALTPDSFKVINTVIFQFRTKKFLSLGYLSVDTSEKSFELAGMNSVGIKLIEIAAKNKEILVNNVIDEISKRGDVAKVLVSDIDRIYFHSIPANNARTRLKKKEVVFIQDDITGRTEYTFAGKGNHLVEKTRYDGKMKTWSVQYYEYMDKDGKVYPKGIIYKNHKYKYKLIITIKEII